MSDGMTDKRGQYTGEEWAAKCAKGAAQSFQRVPEALLTEAGNTIDELRHRAETAEARCADLQARCNRLEKLLTDVRECCLFAEDDGQIGVTNEPTIDDYLFREICAALQHTTEETDETGQSGSRWAERQAEKAANKLVLAVNRALKAETRVKKLENAATDMRERAAKYLEGRAERMGGMSDMARLLEGAAKAIRALPIEKAAPAGEG